MSRLKRVEWGLIGFIIGIITINFLNKPLQNFVSLIPNIEFRIYMQIFLVIIFIVIITLAPIAIMTGDEQETTNE